MAPARSQAGFTLVEVLVASVIMMIGVFGVLAAFPQSFRSAKKSGHQSVLNHLVSEQLDDLRSLDYADSTLALGTHPTQQTDSQSQRYYPVAGFPEEFSLRWTVSNGPTDQSGASVANMKIVVVEGTYLVRYTSGGAPIEQTDSVTVVVPTYLAE